MRTIWIFLSFSFEKFFILWLSDRSWNGSKIDGSLPFTISVLVTNRNMKCLIISNEKSTHFIRSLFILMELFRSNVNESIFSILFLSTCWITVMKLKMSKSWITRCIFQFNITYSTGKSWWISPALMNSFHYMNKFINKVIF